MLKGHLEFGWRRCIVTPSRIRYGPIHVVLDSLPDQCAKDHTSTEMLVSHATYDLAPSSRFQGCANVEATDAITREENPDRRYGAASRLPRPVQTHTTSRMLYGCISRFSYMPSGPSRSAWHSTAGVWSETFRNTGTQPNQKVPLDGLLCLFPSDHGDARVGRVPEGDIATARLARLSSRQHKTTADSAPTRLVMLIGRGGGTHSLVQCCAMGDCGGLGLCDKVRAARHENLPMVG